MGVEETDHPVILRAPIKPGGVAVSASSHRVASGGMAYQAVCHLRQIIGTAERYLLQPAVADGAGLGGVDASMAPRGTTSGVSSGRQCLQQRPRQVRQEEMQAVAEEDVGQRIGQRRDRLRVGMTQAAAFRALSLMAGEADRFVREEQIGRRFTLQRPGVAIEAFHADLAQMEGVGEPERPVWRTEGGAGRGDSEH